MADFPCKGCTDRAVGCHSTCQKYLDAKADYKQEKEVIMKAKADDGDFDGFKISAIIATKKKQGKRR